MRIGSSEDCINGVHMTLRGTIRAEHSGLDAGHEFQDQRRPSMASNSMKSMVVGTLTLTLIRRLGEGGVMVNC